ncbi:S-layer homology domain-containing protein [Maledivibacter halophilus]|uniref:S-layer homology domain-containing protein n=1 Tax=Maledivibacter halophilus TaxID=36842 RepID=A0A1T5MBJ1_9FIRM|nr:S-layer homology domain-containing protein [Maledivibacter halophilus]SKC85611.1 S-layer homology domain-containing protein [Maledivibacter halophilus]
MKKIVTLALVTTLVMTTGFSTAFADSWKHQGGYKLPPGLAKKGFVPPGIAKKFSDINDYKWAKDAIEKMVEEGVIKGVGDGMFAPKQAVTKLEAIVMALRVMGEEEEAVEYGLRIRSGERSLRIKDHLQEWAYGYVALAEEKGILDEADILYFKLNEPAKRHEVAKYIVRALGYEDEAQDRMDEELDFEDASFIPQGSVGYIYIADKEGIITGYEDGTFRPQNTVTRAEMAVMIDRLDDKFDDDDIDEDDLKEYEGTVENIDNGYDWIEIEVGRRDKKFDITKYTKIVFEDDVKGDIEDIEIGDEVEIKVNEDNEAVYIEVDRELYKEYEGRVEDIDNDYDWIEIEVGSRDKRFDITKDTEVVFEDDIKGDIEDIEIGDEIEIKVNDDNEALYIEVDREIYKEYEGTVENIDNGYDWIEIEVGRTDKRFDITNDTEVIFEDDIKGDIEDIEIGDEVEIRVNEDDEIEYIEVDRELESDIYEGFLIEVEDDEISVLVSRKIRSFDLDSDVEVEFKDKDGDLDDLMVGDEIKIIMDEENDEVEKIEVDRKYSSVGVNGKLINVYKNKRRIAIEEDDEIEIYDLESKVKVYINDRKADLSDLEKYDNLYLALDDDEVEEIRAYRIVILD